MSGKTDTKFLIGRAGEDQSALFYTIFILVSELKMDYQKNPYGSAQFASPLDCQQAGLHKQHGLYIGHDASGRACFSDQMSGLLLCGGARSYKGSFITPWLVDGHYTDHVINMDWKGQNGSISALQVLQNRRVINYNPRGKTSHINVLSDIRRNSPTLVPDAKLKAQSIIPLTGVGNSDFFQGNAQRMTEAVTVELARLYDEVTLPLLADHMGLLGSSHEQWLSLEFEMLNSPYPSSRQVAVELQEMRKSSNPNAGGFQGIKGEIDKAFACMSDPQLRASLSPPFDFCFSELVKPDVPAYVVNIMEAMEFAKSSSLVIRMPYTSAMMYKRRHLGSRRQVWIFDEIGNIGHWPLAVDLATYGAGFGVKPVYVTQSYQQLDNLAPKASSIIANSCGTEINIGVRSNQEADRIAKMCGTTTLALPDTITNERVRLENEQAAQSAIAGQVNAFEAGVMIAQNERLLKHKKKIARQLRTADEVRNTDEHTAYVFMPGVLSGALETRFLPYWMRPDLAGRFLGDPYHSPQGKVEIRGRWGQVFQDIITETAPPEIADWPQYRDTGQWSYVKGYRPQLSQKRKR